MHIEYVWFIFAPCLLRRVNGVLVVVVACVSGLFYSASVLGPVVAYIVGGSLLKLYTHFDTVDVSTSVLLYLERRHHHRHHHYVGAV